MSIVRVGLAETKKYAEGYDAIFGKKDAPKAASRGKKTKASAARAKKPRAKKKGTKKK